MNLEVGILWEATQSVEVVERLRLAGVGPSDFDDPAAKRAFKFIVEHVANSGELPELEAVQDVNRCELSSQGVGREWLLEEFTKRKLYRTVASHVEKVSDQLRANMPGDALETIRTFADQGHGANGGLATRLFSLGDTVQAAYDKVRNGYMGMPLPWPSLNLITMGLWPGTCTYFVARPGTGKTHVAMLIAREAWRAGKRVLIISPEMSKEAIAERFFIAHAEVSGECVLRGTLSEFQHKKLTSTIEDLRDKDGVWIVDSEHKLVGETCDQFIQQVKPDIVCVDSVYDMDFKGNKSERTMQAIDWMRKSSKKHDVPFVGFHQLNRSVGRDQKFGGASFEEGADSIALTDQMLWDAHAIFILEQDTDMKADRRLRMHVGKCRRGTWDGNPIDCHWDFETMDFSEIQDDGPSSRFADDDFGVAFD